MLILNGFVSLTGGLTVTPKVYPRKSHEIFMINSITYSICSLLIAVKTYLTEIDYLTSLRCDPGCMPDRYPLGNPASTERVLRLCIGSR